MEHLRLLVRKKSVTLLFSPINNLCDKDKDTHKDKYKAYVCYIFEKHGVQAGEDIDMDNWTW